MAWIEIIEKAQSGSLLESAYEQIRGSRGKVANILKVHSLNPKAMMAHMDLYLAVMFNKSGLSREQREMIAVVVSIRNNCPYCINHHAEALNHYWKDQQRLRMLIDDYKQLDLSQRDRSMLDYAVIITDTPAKVTEDDILQLRSNGFSDDDILSINLITSYFNFVNRIALGLGVEFNSNEVGGYRY